MMLADDDLDLSGLGLAIRMEAESEIHDAHASVAEIDAHFEMVLEIERRIIRTYGPKLSERDCDDLRRDVIDLGAVARRSGVAQSRIMLRQNRRIINELSAELDRVHLSRRRGAR